MSWYITCLLLDGERKSIGPMAARLVDERGEIEAMRQRLQQCVSISSDAASEVPDEIAFRTKWPIALEQIDHALAAGVRRHVILGDGGYGDITEFRRELSSRNLLYVVCVNGEQEMKQELGLDHFEGRSWRASTTTQRCALAHGFLALQRALFPRRRLKWTLPMVRGSFNRYCFDESVSVRSLVGASVPTIQHVASLACDHDRPLPNSILNEIGCGVRWCGVRSDAPVEGAG
jgi:SRSO17 transposase